MIHAQPFNISISSVSEQARRSGRSWWLMMLAIIGISGIFGLLTISQNGSPNLIAWQVFLLCIAAIIYHPRYGVYLIPPLVLVGDPMFTPWLPFAKNFSSMESALYLNDALVFSPLELTVALTYVSWLGRELLLRRLKLFTGGLFWPGVLFFTSITVGLIYGIGRGGDRVIALWSVRTIYLLPLMLILTTHLIENRFQLNVLLWGILVAIFIDSIAAWVFIHNELKYDWSTIEYFAEHSNSIHINTVFVLMIAVWFYRGAYSKRLILPFMLPSMALSYVANQRRAAQVAIVVAMMLFTILLYWRNRRLFMIVVPIGAMLAVVYIAAFWNGGGGAIGAPVRTLRSAIAPQEGSAEESSNEYRLIENVNTMATLKALPLTGVGFGNKFYVVAVLPDISFFEWWEYITHNSILWIWMQMGLYGFLSMIFLVGMAIIIGTRNQMELPDNDLSAINLMMTSYVVMHFVYAYVDMSWESQSMVYVGTAMGIINVIGRIAAHPEPTPLPRWPWQKPQLVKK